MNDFIINDRKLNKYRGKDEVLVIPDGIVNIIGFAAFKSNKRIKNVVLPNEIEFIDVDAFAGCSKLESIHIPSTVKNISFGAFYDCIKLKNIEIPGSVYSICDNAFTGCETLENVTLSYGLIEIGAYAFSNCIKIKEILIPSTTTKINYPFCYCTELENIVVEEENPCYESINGNLFTKDDKTLVQYAMGKQDKLFEIESGTITLGSYSFAGAEHLEEVILPAGLKNINAGVFSGCKNLKKIFIPSSVENISVDVFPQGVAIYLEANEPREYWLDNWHRGNKVIFGAKLR